MDTPQIERQVKELQSQVAPYSKNKPASTLSQFNFLQNPLFPYLSIPVAILLLLLVFRPGFLYYDKNNGKDVVRSISIKKIFLYWLILSSVLVVGLFGYNYTKNK